MKRRSFLSGTTGTLALAATPALLADGSLAEKACRSIHLGYPGPAATAFYCEVTPRASAAGTYFMVCGWNTGYFGIQELGNNKKVLLFSVWDPGNTNNPNEVAKEKRVELVYKDESVRVGRFGGEGTGGQAFLDYDWKLAATYRCLVAAKAVGERTEYTGYFFHPEKNEWIKLVTFNRIGGWKPLSGFYSFVEDFRRNGESAKQVHKAEFGNVWLQPEKGELQFPGEAHFTGDDNPAKNIDAGSVDDRYFYLATGGTTLDGSAKLNGKIKLQATDEKRQPPQDLPKLE